MALGYLIQPFIQVQDINGTPVVGARVYVYEADTTDFAVTYRDFEGHRNQNPIITDELGNFTVVADSEMMYDMVINDADDNLLFSKKQLSVNFAGSDGSISVQAGTGISVGQSGNTYVINVDTDYIATQEDLATKQDRLYAGDNISIVDNIISSSYHDTTYTATAPLAIDSTNHISIMLGTGLITQNSSLALDTSYIATQANLSDYLRMDHIVAGANMSITNNSSYITFAATDTTYTFSTGLTENAGIVIVDNPVPTASSSDNGKVLGVTNSLGNIGWVSLPADELPSIAGNSGKVLKVNSGATGVEWATDQNTTYSAGSGLTLNGTTFSADTTVLATKTDLAGKQDKLTAGSNITISNNVISATDTTYTFSTGLAESSGTVTVVNPVPTASSSDNGKVLGVTDNQGTLGWVSQPSDELPSISGNSGKVLKVNSGATGVEWATDQNTTYSAGTGLTLNGTTFTADTTVLATKTDLADKQDKLTAGSNITIANNVISSTDTIESIKLNGTALTITNKSVNIPLATTTDPGAMSATDKATISNLATVATTGSYNDLTNIPANLVQDASYVHTDNNFTNTLKTKLDGIATGAEVNVQANWNQTDSAADDYIKNKPSIPAAQVQSDWSESDNTKPDFIKNKPTIPTYSAGAGIGISSNVISRKVQFVTTSSTYSTIRNILDDGDVPVLDVSNGSYHNYFLPTNKSDTHVDFIGSMGYSTYPTYESANYMLKYSVDNNNSWTVTKYHELPNYTSTESNKFLQVNSSGNGVEWGALTQIPAYTSSDENKVLSVGYNGSSIQWRDVREVPSYAVANQGYLLGVVNNGGTAELAWTQPSGYWTQSVDFSGYHTITADDISAGHIDFEGTISASDTSSSTTKPTYAALAWDVRLNSGIPSTAISSVDFALGVSGGSYDTIFSDTSPAHEVHKDWGITRSWVLNTKKNRVRARCNLTSGASVGTVITMNGGGIVTQVR